MIKKYSNQIIKICHFISCFNNSIYGIFATMFASIYFYNEIFYSYLAFFAGYIFRPLGAALWGKIGDTKGRKTAFLSSIILSGLPQIIIGFLPGTNKIGIIAPVIIILLRIIQGVLYGAESAGISLYVYENKNKSNCLGLEACIATCFGLLGLVIASIIGAIFTSHFFPIWFWRIALIMGGLCSIIIYFVRDSIQETSAYKDNIDNRAQYKVLNIIKNNYLKIFFVALFEELACAPLHFMTVFGNSLFIKKWGFSQSQSLYFNSFTFTLFILFILFFGNLSKFISLNKQIIYGLIILSIAPYIAFYIINHNNLNTMHLISFILILTFASSSICGFFLTYAIGLFNINERYLCIAMGSNIGSFIAGLNPILFQTMIKKFGDNSISCFISGIAILTLIMMFLINYNKQYLYKNDNIG